jgi:amino acid transporter
VTLIVVVVALVLARHGLHGDPNQLHLHGMTSSGLRLGLVLALFRLVDFQSATTLGSEAREPLKTIPRAVMQTAILGGVFFAICAYTEVLGPHMGGEDLATNQAPLHVLSRVLGIPVLGLLIDIGALVSLFAGVLACITAAARVLLLMSHEGLTHQSLRVTHARNETPAGAIVASGLAAFIPVAVLAGGGASGLDVYGWMGSLATYGFIVTYRLVCFALPDYLRDHHGVVNAATRTIPWIGAITMVLALGANLDPRARGTVWQAALYLSSLPDRRSFVVRGSLAHENFRRRRNIAPMFAICARLLFSFLHSSPRIDSLIPERQQHWGPERSR